ncbi:MAG: ribonuclease catalytic domain-containing protein [Synechococcaceae cyanobacterium]|nr:ribonuclease catalytic domain-containing protein [Synechococcaceae cyanobacterium]
MRRPPAAGDLVGLIEDGRPRLAVVSAVRGSRIDLRVGSEGRALQRGLRQIDPIAALPPGLSPPERLRQPPWRLERSALGRCLPAGRDFAAAWLLLRESGESTDLAGLVSLLGDPADPCLRAACWQWLHGPQTFFRWRQQRVEARAAADVRRLRQERRRQHLEQEGRQRWQQALRARRPIDADGLAPAQRRQLDLLRAWAGGECHEDLPDDLRRMLQAAHCHAEAGAIRHLLVDLGQWERHHLPSLERTRWQGGFPPDLVAEAERLLALAEGSLPGDGIRSDRTGLRTVTIDDDDTEDIDDGLALERTPGGGERLWIHIADPGRLVEPDSPLDREARRRATSLYLACGTLPMFPMELATGPFSLRAGRRCAAWSLWVDLAEEGAVAAWGLERSWVRPAYRLSYAEADELIELAPPQEDHLARLHALMERRRSWRLARGALTLEQAEGRIRAEQERARLEITEPCPSRRMVAEAMVLAGAVIAEHGRRLGLALPFRGQLPAPLPAAAELEALPPGPVRHAVLKSCLGRGQVGTRPAPHVSLGLEAYVQATSPIRRYGDLLVQRQLQAVAAGEATLSEADLAALLTELEGPLRQAVQISREDQRHWLQVWFEQQEQPQWPALFLRWLRPQDHLGLVHVEELAMDLAATCPAGAVPGEPLLVRVLEVDSLRDRLRLQAVA